ncbi:MAG TPA: DUF1150 family protein [Stellaceae bacterium]|nr:DUF1150 family protein [Stellaceae bacterium]
MLALLKSKQLSPEEFSALGCPDTAYVKRVDAEGIEAYAAHAADGSYLMLFADRDLAFAELRRHDLEPVSIH